jgi:peptide/nickel transport system substrate-binding protein
MLFEISRRRLLAAAALPALKAIPARAAETVLRVVAPWEFDSPDPLETGYILRRMSIGETLVGVHPNGQLFGLLAESWAVDPDHLTWRFQIRNARFHDGSPVTAGVVAKALERVRSEAESLSAVPVAELRSENNRTLLIRTTTPFAPLPSALTDYAGTILAPSAYDAAGRPQRPITGVRSLRSHRCATPPSCWATRAPAWRRPAKPTWRLRCCHRPRRPSSGPEMRESCA